MAGCSLADIHVFQSPDQNDYFRIWLGDGTMIYIESIGTMLMFWKPITFANFKRILLEKQFFEVSNKKNPPKLVFQPRGFVLGIKYCEFIRIYDPIWISIPALFMWMPINMRL